ncbi:sterol desaturase family protein [Leptolyngbyaceae cyanobacterium CCMR0082]|uniref:Sterol desaturase family protein n=1 Tax=Adonisia turfae CCMR0082 TaxID=2304604 RepID=A0A6M0SCW1_9CYAN|nr:sterol desaturase family protein [Adonisia turfae]NEZ65512.1 sterol desaturase family protein [Adonisia turfae CCMR0082]
MDIDFTRFDGFMEIFEALELIDLIFFVAIILEAVWDIVFVRRRAQGETFANSGIAFVGLLLDRTFYGLVFVLGLFAVEYFIPWRLPLTWWTWGMALILADFTYYWMHRWEHEVRILWSYHSVHHSSPEYNLTTSLRLAWVESLIEWIFFIPMILIGFDVIQTLIALVIVVVYQTWIHTERIGKLGWLDNIFNTPSVHRVHHGVGPRCIDKNYGGILIIWDHLFDTYQAETEKITYGLTKQIGSVNPIVINFYELWQIIKDVRYSKRFSCALKYIFGKPGWQPNGKK